MKNTIMSELKFSAVLVGSMAILFWGTACSNNDKTGDKDMEIVDVTKEKVSDAVDATKNAAKATKDATVDAWKGFSEATVDNKDDAVDFLNKQLIALDQKVETLSDKSKKMAGDGKESMDKSIVALKEKRADLALQIEKTKNATSETWTAVKLETQKKWNSFSESVQELANKVKGSS